jgi:hypothetical protein
MPSEPISFDGVTPAATSASTISLSRRRAMAGGQK